MTNYSDKLVQKVQNALIGSINETSILYALVLLNKAVQDTHSVSKFLTINLYRDWLVHTNLDRKRHLELFFTEWDKIIEDIRKGSGRQGATEASLSSLALSKLFDEMQTLGITLESTQKDQFVVALVSSLLDAPLRWDGEHIKEFRFTYEVERKKSHSSYICHMQIQLTTGEWFDCTELHFKTS